MSASKSRKSPPRSKLTLNDREATCARRLISTIIDRLLAYKPIVSSEAKPDPPHSNTKGQAPSGRNVGKLMELLKMPPDVFREVLYERYTLRATKSCIDCFKSPSGRYSSPLSRVPKDSGHPDVKKLGLHLDHREEGA